ncbi:predicted protein [Plenodomus lingam JN3]|uniref:Predicted protein n=1 Tax=Leptosphaeria maculans (strain JN3 / isolate v23.1.3 / race Av1-4-5-6-7-8) TaxID=985895 RepID=E4ZKA5_LEPMJ|nr:predicted protein [Plenodomus lingam JN3]CBX91700.1 predicted protein [Plenodomus lingam JN3]
MRASTSHFLRSVTFSNPPSRSAAHGRRTPSASISKISSTSSPCCGMISSKNGATFARPGIHKQSAARMRV